MMTANDPSHVNGPAFVGIAVRDVDRSADFYEHVVGFRRDPEVFPEAVAFLTQPIPFAVTGVRAGTTLADKPSGGISLWFRANDAGAVYDKMVEAGVTIAAQPGPGPLAGRFGTQFTFTDPDGYSITIYDRD
jgi:catechol 2,3-dioxygenase-like lactoylglutathione lyase family enzyme